MITCWQIWNWLGLTRTAKTAHGLHKAMHKALTPDEVHALAVYNDERYQGVTHDDQVQTAMRALQDRYDTAVREYARHERKGIKGE